MTRQRPSLSTRCATAILGCAGVIGILSMPAGAAPFELPALTSPPSRLHLQGKLIWLDLETTDLSGAERFYHGLFGWEYRDYHAYGVDYVVALVNGQPAAGLVRRPIVRDTERHSAWLPFFSVTEVDATAALAGTTHAAVSAAPEDLPQRGRQARLIDPAGAVFAVLASSSGDPPDDPNPRAVGSFGAPALLAQNPVQEAVFYQDLFGYKAMDAPAGDAFERIRLSGDAHERAIIRGLADGGPVPTTQWVAFVRVFSLADTLQKTVKAGGRIVIATTRASHGASLAILADPSGALFGVMQLPPETARR